MSIGSDIKLDAVYKKITGYVAETSVSGKEVFNENISSPLIVFNEHIWGDSAAIPIPASGASTSIAVKHSTTSSVQCLVDPTVAGYRTWVAVSSTADPIDSSNILKNWIPSFVDPTYLIQVYSGDPSTTGVLLNPVSANYEFIFDYAAGVLHFPNTVPSSVSSNGIYLVGYTYDGILGVSGSTGGAGGHTIQNSSSANMTARTYLRFSSPFVTTDVGSTATDVSLTSDLILNSLQLNSDTTAKIIFGADNVTEVFHLRGEYNRQNIFFGINAGGTNAHAGTIQNIGIGYYSLNSIGNASLGNIAIGDTSGDQLTTGDRNILIGWSVGASNVITWNDSIAIGTAAAATVNQAIAIGASAVSDSIAIGAAAVGATKPSIAFGDYVTGKQYALVLGSATDNNYRLTDIYFGRGFSSTASISSITATLHATDANSTDSIGATLALASGIGTGLGVGGNILLQVSSASAGSGSLPNSLITKMSIASTGVNIFTLLSVTGDSTLAGVTSSSANLINNTLTVTGDTVLSSFTVAKSPFVSITSTSYVFALTDAQYIVEFTSTAAITATITANGTVAFPIGTRIDVLRMGSGTLSILAGDGVTLNGATGTTKAVSNQYSGATLLKRDTDTWIIFGDIT